MKSLKTDLLDVCCTAGAHVQGKYAEKRKSIVIFNSLFKFKLIYKIVGAYNIYFHKVDSIGNHFINIRHLVYVFH